MPAPVPGLRRDNVDVSRARARREKGRREEQARKREGKRKGEDAREERDMRYWPNSRACLDTLMSFRAVGLRPTRDAHAVYISRAPDVSRTFIAAESEFLLYAGSHSAPDPTDLPQSTARWAFQNEFFPELADGTPSLLYHRSRWRNIRNIFRRLRIDFFINSV